MVKLDITYSLMADNVYTSDCAVVKLIKIINLFVLEQQVAIMLEINHILEWTE